jgi:hypothetical protein
MKLLALSRPLTTTPENPMFTRKRQCAPPGVTLPSIQLSLYSLIALNHVRRPQALWTGITSGHLIWQMAG